MRPNKFYGYGFNNSEEFAIYWNLGNSCNWKCDYCPNYLNDGSVYWTENSIVQNTLLKLKTHLNNRPLRVEFMGGEVTLKPDFIELIKFCRDNKIKTHILTNASRTINYWQKLSPFLDSALCSFHPLNASKEHYEAVVQTLLENGCNPIIHIAMVKDKFEEMKEYKNYLINKFNNMVSVDFMLLYDKEFKYNYNGYFYDYTKDQINFLQDNTTKHYVAEYENGEIRYLNYVDIREANLNNFEGFLCGSTYSIMNVDYRGGASISVCNQRRSINVTSDSFDEFLKPKICKTNQCINPSDLKIFKYKISQGQ